MAVRSGQNSVARAGLLCIALLTGSPRSLLAEDRAKSFAQDLAAARRAGIPTTPQELQAPLPPPEENAAPLYTELTKILEAKPLSKDQKIINDSDHRGVLSPVQFELLRRALKSRSDLASLVHRAVARPQCVFTRDWTAPYYAPEPEAVTMRFAARVIAAESQLMAHDGKALEATRHLAFGFKIARHAAANRLMGYALANSIDSMTLAGFQKRLYLSASDAKIIEATLSCVKNRYAPPSLSKQIKFGAGCDLVMFEFFRKKGARKGKEKYREQFMPGNKAASLKDWNAFIDANSRAVLKYAYRLISAANRLYWSGESAFRAVRLEMESDKNPQHALVQLSQTNIGGAEEFGTRSKAIAEVTRAGAFALYWKAKHGAFPDTLGDASSPKFVDPFDGKPLKYRKEGAGFVVYSVGATGKFTGGAPNLNAGNETRFRYPAPPEFTAPWMGEQGRIGGELHARLKSEL